MLFASCIRSMGCCNPPHSRGAVDTDRSRSLTPDEIRERQREREMRPRLMTELSQTRFIHVCTNTNHPRVLDVARPRRASRYISRGRQVSAMEDWLFAVWHWSACGYLHTRTRNSCYFSSEQFQLFHLWLTLTIVSHRGRPRFAFRIGSGCSHPLRPEFPLHRTVIRFENCRNWQNLKSICERIFRVQFRI